MLLTHPAFHIFFGLQRKQRNSRKKTKNKKQKTSISTSITKLKHFNVWIIVSQQTVENS